MTNLIDANQLASAIVREASGLAAPGDLDNPLNPYAVKALLVGWECDANDVRMSRDSRDVLVWISGKACKIAKATLWPEAV